MRYCLHASNIHFFAYASQGYNSVYSTDSAEESEKERCRKASLGRLARKRFEAMIRAMTGKRGELARCMVFGLDHAEAAAEVGTFRPFQYQADSLAWRFRRLS